MTESATFGLTHTTVPAGVDVIAEGERTGRLYMLVAGKVRVHSHGLEIDVVDRPGSFFGETSILLGGEPRATVTTIEASTVGFTDDPMGFWIANPSYVIAMATEVATRLDLITGYLRDLREQYADRSDHLGVITDVLQSLLHHQGDTVEPGSEREPDAPY